MAAVIGTVTTVVGMAIVVDEQGEQHLLKVGDVLHDGERVITSAGATVTVSADSHAVIQLHESQTIQLSEQIVESNVSDASESAVNQAVFQQIIAAVSAGQDVGVSQDPNDALLTILPNNEGNSTDGLSALLDGELLSNDSIAEVVDAGLLTEQLSAVPDPLATTGTVLNEVVDGMLDLSNPLSAGELLGVEAPTTLDLLTTVENTTTVTSDALSLLKEPILISALSIEQNLLGNE